MFDIANTSVAMKNSHKDLFSHATTVTDSVDNQGVLKFLKSETLKRYSNPTGASEEPTKEDGV